MTGGGHRLAGIAGLTLALALSAAQPAPATFHDMLIREVYPGSIAQPGSEYVELQMWSGGQNLVGGHSLAFYNAAGAQAGTATFGQDVGGAANQSTLVAASPAAESEFGFSGDTGLSPALIDPAGGAVCWEALDCVAWGNFAGTAKSPTGQPAAAGGISDGMALRRTIAPGCATLLEPGDDRDDSAVNFSATFPGPRPNSVPPSEHVCSTQAAGGGSQESGSGTGAGRRPQTRISHRPGHRTHDRTPTFRFTSNEPGATYFCRIDARRFKRCGSPFTLPRLGYGRHVLAVKARGPSGVADLSPATYGFRIVRR